jgi:hypothetical protein
VTTKNRALLLGSVAEDHFQRDVVTYAESHGWLWNHNPDSRKSKAGLPDLILVRCLGNGDWRLIFAELKTEKGGVRPKQRLWLNALGRVASMCQGHVIVALWRPSNFEEIVETLK